MLLQKVAGGLGGAGLAEAQSVDGAMRASIAYAGASIYCGQGNCASRAGLVICELRAGADCVQHGQSGLCWVEGEVVGRHALESPLQHNCTHASYNVV